MEDWELVESVDVKEGCNGVRIQLNYFRGIHVDGAIDEHNWADWME